MSDASEYHDLLPQEPIHVIIEPIRRFLHIEATSGVVLVAGPGFAKALLRVWLGDKPADASLKKALLGG